jgi:hypothetical protein
MTPAPLTRAADALFPDMQVVAKQVLARTTLGALGRPIG